MPGALLAHQAVDSLRGYAYQVLAAALAWVELPKNAELHLEVAEDYAVVAKTALDVFQVKDTRKSGRVTLNTPAVCSAIDRFVALFQHSSSSDIRLRYLTTAEIGIERPPLNIPPGEAGLEYWRRCAAGAPVEPLRQVLSSSRLSRAVRTFCETRDDDTLRRDLFRRIHWDCHQPDLAATRKALDDRLVEIGRDKFGVPSSEVPVLADVLLAFVLRKSIEADPAQRTLTRADLYRGIDRATHVSIPRSRLSSIARAVPDTTALMTDSFTAIGTTERPNTTWIVHRRALPPQGRTIGRSALELEIATALDTSGVCFLFGSSGVGKSTTVRSMTSVESFESHVVDFRNASPADASSRLVALLQYLPTLGPGTIILEDLNVLHDTQTRLHASPLFAAMRRLDIRSIITCYRKPSTTGLLDMGLDPQCVVSCPYFSRDETRALVAEYGGDSSMWGDLAHTVGGDGHPQLVHAFINSLDHEGWPSARAQSIPRAITTPARDAATVGDARRRVVSELPDDARQLLYRLSLAAVHVNRATALAVASSTPAPGEALEQLIGPWIEPIGLDLLRVSPLARAFARGMLPAGEEIRVHKTIATETLATNTLVLTDLNALFHHCLQGESEESLFKLAWSVFVQPSHDLSRISAHFSVLRDWPTDKPFAKIEPKASAMLRLTQWRLLVESDEQSDLTLVVAAALGAVAEVQEEPMRKVLEAWILSYVLTRHGVANQVKNWVSLLVHAGEARRTNNVLAGFAKGLEDQTEAERVPFLARLFAIGAIGIKTVSRLEAVMADLDKVDTPQRNLLLTPRIEDASYYSLVAGGPCTTEMKSAAFDPDEAMKRYGRMEKMVGMWEVPTLTGHFSAARAFLLDEHGKRGNAIEVLNNAQRVYGSDVALFRERGRIHSNRGEYADALQAFQKVMPEANRYVPFERSVVARDAAVSAAQCNKWGDSERWFGEAQAAKKREASTVDWLSVAALEADAAAAALMAGDVSRAIKRFAIALDQLVRDDADDSVRAAYCQRVIRHAVLWCYGRVANKAIKGITNEPIVFRPGMCSNPDPNPEIRNHPLGPSDLGWYMLAQAETIAGVDVGVTTGLDTRLKEGRIPFSDCSLRWQQMVASIEKTDADGVANHLTPYLEASVYLDRNKDRLRDTWDALNPERGEIPALTGAMVRSAFVKRAVGECLVTFAICGVLSGENGALTHVLDRLVQKHEACASVWDLRGDFVSALLPSDVSAQSILDSIEVYERKVRTDPEFVWGMSFAFLRWIVQSDFTDALVRPLARWLRVEWRRITTEELDRLRAPDLTMPRIQDVLNSPADDVEFIVALLRNTLEGAFTVGRERYRKALSQVIPG